MQILRQRKTNLFSEQEWYPDSFRSPSIRWFAKLFRWTRDSRCSRRCPSAARCESSGSCSSPCEVDDVSSGNRKRPKWSEKRGTKRRPRPSELPISEWQWTLLLSSKRFRQIPSFFPAALQSKRRFLWGRFGLLRSPTISKRCSRFRDEVRWRWISALESSSCWRRRSW